MNKSFVIAVVSALIFQCQETMAEIVLPEGYCSEVYALCVNIGVPKAIGFDAGGYLYLAQDGAGSRRIHRIAPGGSPIIAWGPALGDPDCLALDSDNNCYVGSGSQGLYRILPNGTSSRVTTFNMGNNFSVCVDKAGVLGSSNAVYVGNARASTDIVKVTSSGTATAFASSSLLYTFSDMDVDDSGYLYATETGSNHAVLRITSSGVVSTFAAFANPYCIAFHKGTRNFYVGDTSEDRIYRMGLDGSKTLFATGINPVGVAFGPDGTLYVVDTATNPDRILRISRCSKEVRFGTGEELVWNSISGNVYEVEFRTNLMYGSWITLNPQVTATNIEAAASVSFTNSPSGFFRVVLPAPGFF